MSAATPAILAISAALYALRLAGLALPAGWLPPAARAILARFPAALFAALLASALAGPGPAAGGGLAGAVALAGLITYRTRQPGLGLLAGLAALLLAAAL